MSESEKQRVLIPAFLVGLGYLVAAQLSLALTVQVEGIATLWLPSGLLLGALLRAPRRYWSPILAAAGAADLAVGIAATHHVVASAGIMTANLGEGALGALLIRRFAGEQLRLGSLREVAVVAVVAGAISTPLSALLGTAGQVLAGARGPFWRSWEIWWASDALGALVVAPAILTWRWGDGRGTTPGRWRAAEVSVLVGAVVGASVLAFHHSAERGGAGLPWQWLAFPLFVWASLRFGARGVSLAGLALALAAAWPTAQGRGVFAALAGSPAQRILWLQAFLLATVLTALLLAAAAEQQRNAADAAREHGRRLATLMGNLPGLAYRRRNDREWTMEFLSEGCRALTGYPVADLIENRRLSYRDLIVPEDRQAVSDAVHGALALRRPWEIEYGIRTADGSIRVAWERGCGNFAPDGTVRSLEGFISDITQRKRAQEALHESQAAFRALINALPSPAFLIDRDGTLLAANRALAQSLGVGATELAGWDAYRLLPATIASGRRARLERAFETGQPESFEDRHNGRAFINYLCPVVDRSGRVTNLAVFALDITGRIDAEEALRRSESRFRLMAEQTGRVMYDYDVTVGQITWEGAIQSLTGFGREEVRQHDLEAWAEMVHPDDRSRALRDLERARAACGTYASEYRLRRKDGSYIVVDDTGVFLPGEHGIPARMLGMIGDITPRRQAEEALRRAHKMEALGTLAGGIAHDFNNILGAISVNLELLEEELPAPAPEMLGEIRSAARRAADLVRQILTFSRRREQQRQVVALGPLVNEIARLLRAALPATIEIRLELGADLPPVLADSSQIHQVLMNLAANAGHAMRRGGGLLTVALDREMVSPQRAAAVAGLTPGPYLRMTVSDTGEGMDAATLERAFEPFFTTKSPGEGTGLGLSVVHGIVSSHDGAVSIISRPGEGTAVLVHLPAVAKTGEHLVQAARPVPTGHGEHILVVDDERALAHATARLLETLGYTATGFTSPEAALEAFRAEPARYAAVVTDLTMPKMTGLELGRRLLGVRPDVPIVIVTGYATLTPEAARGHGIRCILPKPTSREAIAHALADAFAGRAPTSRPPAA